MDMPSVPRGMCKQNGSPFDPGRRPRSVVPAPPAARDLLPDRGDVPTRRTSLRLLDPLPPTNPVTYRPVVQGRHAAH